MLLPCKMSMNCPDCGKQFYHSSNLKRHMKTINCKRKLEKQIFECAFCEKLFKRNYSLRLHLSSVHKINTDVKVHKCNVCSYETVNTSNLQKHIKQVHCPKDKKDNRPRLYGCNLCEAKYIHAPHLYRHKVKSHGERKTLVRKKKCPLCSFAVTVHGGNKKEMYSHLQNKHSISLTHEIREFNSLPEFYNWKSTLEKETKTKFITVSKTSTTLTFKCHRSGYYIPKGNNKRKLKTVGSCKINAFCPAIIIAKISECGPIVVKFQNTHIGHNNELRDIELTEGSDVQDGGDLPHDDILKGTNSSLTNLELKRINNIIKQDIKRIAMSFNLDTEAMQQTYDSESVEAVVINLTLSDITSLVIYKPKGCYDDNNFAELNTEDFFLVIMTEAQKEFFLQHSQDIVCIDGTQSNSNKLQLYTFLTVEESMEGFPVAFMFTNRCDETVMTLFFKKLQEHIGVVKPRVFMSDMGDIFYQAWEKVMGSCDLRLYCKWHLFQAWRRNCNKKIKIKEKQNNALKMLHNLLYELDSLTFHKMLEEAIQTWSSDNDTYDFSSYFVQYYVINDQFTKWAYCYRTNAGVNTIISLENFNKVLNCCCLRGKKVKRLENTLFTILNLLQDNLFDLLLKINERKILGKLHNLRQQHKLSCSMKEDFIIMVKENEWQVVSTVSNQFFIVRKVKKCNTCVLVCTVCKSCFHEYVCSCPNSVIQNNMCKHIHFIASTREKTTEEIVEEIEVGLTVNVTQNGDVETEEIIPSKHEINVTKVTNGSISLQVKKSKLAEKLTKFIEEHVETDEEVEYVEQYFHTLYPNLLAMKKTPRINSVCSYLIESSHESENVLFSEDDLLSHKINSTTLK